MVVEKNDKIGSCQKEMHSQGYDLRYTKRKYEWMKETGWTL